MTAKRLGDRRDDFAVGHIDQIAGEPLELPQFGLTAALARDELLDNPLQQLAYRALSLALTGKHGFPAPSKDASTFKDCKQGLLTQH
jgi:hypothetical protein